MQLGVYMKRTLFDVHTILEQKVYAHRQRKGIFVIEFSLSGSPSINQTISLNVNPGDPSTDIDFKTTRTTTQVIRTGLIREQEEDYTPRIQVALVHTLVPSSLTLKGGDKVALLFSFATTLDVRPQLDPVFVAGKSYSEAAALSPDQLYSEHTALWHQLSASGVFVKGNLELAQAINSSNYYILSSIRDDWNYSLSPGGLASNSYNGHTFWDCETWMYPAILPFHPEIAEGILRYRYDRIDGAMRKARSYDPPYDGAMFPWESALSGEETCPRGVGTCTREIHISGDISFAAAQFYEMTADKKWREQFGYPLVSSIADFWVSRATPDGTSILNVIPPDEYHDHVSNSAYTNAVAIFSLALADGWAKELGKTTNPRWLAVANNLTIPRDPNTNLILEYDGYTDDTIKQADVILLAYPLGFPLEKGDAEQILSFYTPKTDPEGPAMTWAMTVIGYLEINRPNEASKFFKEAYANIHAPFNVWFETPEGGAVNFITGAGGFLQMTTFGYSGLRISSGSDELIFLNQPHMFPDTQSFSLIGVKYLGNTLDIYFTETQVQIFSDQKGVPLVAKKQPLTTTGLTVQRDGVVFTIKRA